MPTPSNEPGTPGAAQRVHAGDPGRRHTVWVLIADEAIARILQWPQQSHMLEPVEELTDPTAHAREADMHRDAQGRRAGGGGAGKGPGGSTRAQGGASVTASAGEGEKHLEARAFARRVAEHLGEALRAQRFDELRIVAAPRFLGELRKALDPQVQAVVAATVDKDLVHEDNAELTRRLFPSQ